MTLASDRSTARLMVVLTAQCPAPCPARSDLSQVEVDLGVLGFFRRELRWLEVNWL